MYLYKILIVRDKLQKLNIVKRCSSPELQRFFKKKAEK